ncbi:MAG: leucyl/phenylalanyl-tRNA--protein transferase [Flavobacteriaceae bacterium]|nr:leucyl/phenylalanyl-tRNA--protein transferase [Flavobacteriaceae bacterium]
MQWLTHIHSFPAAQTASEDGLLALGGDLSPDRLMVAYQNGIFPWYEEGQPILWWSPDPRMVLFLDNARISKSLHKTIRSNRFKVTFNQNFPEVIEACASVPREGQGGTWITDEMQKAYIQLHDRGHAVSVEVWENDLLVGGLYGIDLPEKRIFCGESMFTKVSNASKVGFASLINYLKDNNYNLIDCQVYTSHLERFGAEEIPRDEFLKYLNS